jgi:enamine deaminase RidA (YjgF/YER057c/UK114 family)
MFKLEGRLGFVRRVVALAGAATVVPSVLDAHSAAAPTPGKTYIKNVHGQANSYSQAVITAPGRMVWLAGQTGAVDDAGKPIVDFDGQVRQIFHLFGITLAQADAKLSDIVSMTCFLKDIRYAKNLTTLRGQILGDNFPGSAVINITALATPTTLIEIQAVAVVNS